VSVSYQQTMRHKLTAALSGQTTIAPVAVTPVSVTIRRDPDSCPLIAKPNSAPPVDAGEVASTIGATSHLVKKFTTAPIEPGAIGSPEFCRPADNRRLFGLGRSYTYQLIASGAIRSICLRKPGAKTGIRLIDVESVRAFIRAQFTNANDQR
jgi:hypothetical protein